MVLVDTSVFTVIMEIVHNPKSEYGQHGQQVEAGTLWLCEVAAGSDPLETLRLKWRSGKDVPEAGKEISGCHWQTGLSGESIYGTSRHL